MFTKPHYRQMCIEDVKLGMRVYSPLAKTSVEILGRTTFPGRIELDGNWLTFSRKKGALIWIETQPRGLK